MRNYAPGLNPDLVETHCYSLSFCAARDFVPDDGGFFYSDY